MDLRNLVWFECEHSGLVPFVDFYAAAQEDGFAEENTIIGHVKLQLMRERVQDLTRDLLLVKRHLSMLR